MHGTFDIYRRHLLSGLGLGFLSLGLGCHSSLASARVSTPKQLIVLELFGGNDALNTLPPLRDPLYRRYRPTLALPEREIIALDTEIGLNVAWGELAKLFQRGELAIVQDVGYPDPNLSHFASAAIWASARLEPGQHPGWAGLMLGGVSHGGDLDGIVLSGNEDILNAPGARILTLQDRKSFFAEQDNAPPASPIEANSVRQHITRLLRENAQIRQRVRSRLSGHNRFAGWFARDGYTDPLHAQAELMLWLIESGVHSPLYKLSLSGFDLHANLRGEHERLLEKVQSTLLGLRRGLMEMGAWQDSLILVHSEFGRRPQENASAGCDHGTCGPVLLLGGSVKGGLYGQRSSLEELDAVGNPLFSTDFRSLYGAIAERFWGFPGAAGQFAGIEPLALPI